MSAPDAKRRITNISEIQEKGAPHQDDEINELGALTPSVIAHKSLLPLNRHVPYEILADIFERTVPVPPDGYANISMSQPPLLLARVCSAWRAAAISTPQLWNTISFGRIANKRKKNHFSAIFALWISRSGSLPLHIKLVGLQPTSSEHAVALLLPLTGRIQTLHTSLSYMLLERLLGNNVSQLAMLKLVSAAKPEMMVVSDTAVNLRSLTLLRLNEICLMVLPWHHLAEITVKDHITYDECFEIFALCRQLVHLSLRYIRGLHDEDARRPRATLPHLITLSLSTNEIPDPLLDNLTLPAVQDIILDVADRNWPREELLALVKRSKSPLRSTVVPKATVGPDELLDLVLRIPTLRRISYGGIMDDLPKDVAQLLASRLESDEIAAHSANGPSSEAKVGGSMTNLLHDKIDVFREIGSSPPY